MAKKIIDVVYVVVRYDNLLDITTKTNIKAFRTLESADIMAEIFNEEFKELGYNEIEFKVEMVNVYD